MHILRAVHAVPVHKADPGSNPYKDKANECELFSPRVTVSRDGARPVGRSPSALAAKFRPRLSFALLMTPAPHSTIYSRSDHAHRRTP